MGEEEEDEAHAVDDDAEVLEEGGDGARPEVAQLEFERVFDEAEAEDEREGGRVHDHGEEAGGDRVETERGDGHEHSERLFRKRNKKSTWDLSKDRGECKAGSGSPGR